MTVIVLLNVKCERYVVRYEMRYEMGDNENADCDKKSCDENEN